MPTYNNPNHRNPHRKPSSRLLAEEKRQYTSRETSEIVDRHDDALESRRWMIERVQEVLVADDSTENALVVSEEHKGQLTSNRDCGSQLEASPVKIVLEHGVGSDDKRIEEAGSNNEPSRRTAGR